MARSTADAQRQRARFDTPLDYLEARLQRLWPQADERATDVQVRMQALLARHRATDDVTVTVTETVTVRWKTRTHGRLSATIPPVEETVHTQHTTIERNAEVVADARTVLGWRGYVTRHCPG